MTTVITLSGRRIDADGVAIPRFPKEMIPHVRNDLQRIFMHYSAAFIVSSAAAGTDLLGLQVALKLRIPCRVIIFGSIAEFKRISVSDRGPEWERTFDDVLESAGISDIVVVPPGPDDGISFRSVNDRIFSEAISIRDSERVERIVAVAVWDNKRKSASDFTAEYIGIANRFDIPVISVASL